MIYRIYDNMGGYYVTDSPAEAHRRYWMLAEDGYDPKLFIDEEEKCHQNTH